MLIGYKDEENDAHTSTHTSTHTSSIDIQPSSENVTRLVLAIGKEEMSVKSMMEAVGLKNRPNKSICPTLSKKFCKLRTNAHNISIHQLDTNTGANLFGNSEHLDLMRMT